MKREKIIVLTKSREEFFKMVNICNMKYRAISPSLLQYRKIIEKHNQYGDMKKLLADNELYELMYSTLKAWNMNQRGARLVHFGVFKNSILNNESILQDLYKFHIEKIKDDEQQIILLKLEKLFTDLKVMSSQSRIVGVTKTMHFLLPNLVMPIDRKYTLNFFYWHNAYNKGAVKEFKTFTEIFTTFREIAKINRLTEKDVDKSDWNTSIPKLIDNALIGISNE